jgi:hypothetical protein
MQPLSAGKAFTFAGIKAPTAPAPAPTRQQQAAQPAATPAAAGPAKIDALQISGLYLSNPPNEKEQRMIDEFVDSLRKSPAFLLDGKKNEEIITQRTTPDGRSWAYAYSIILPLRNPIALP